MVQHLRNCKKKLLELSVRKNKLIEQYRTKSSDNEFKNHRSYAKFSRTYCEKVRSKLLPATVWWWRQVDVFPTSWLIYCRPRLTPVKRNGMIIIISSSSSSRAIAVLFPESFRHACSASETEANVTRNSRAPKLSRIFTRQTVLKRTYFMAVIDGEFCLRMGAVHRPEPRFGCRVWVKWDYGLL